jgi:hypothetical protein
MFLPRLLATILLIVSLAMLVPIGSAVMAIAGGAHIPPTRWLIPLLILGTGAIMTWMLTRKTIPMQLYVAAFALWVITAGYFFVVIEVR